MTTFTRDDAAEVRQYLSLYADARLEHDTKDSICWANELAAAFPRALATLEETRNSLNAIRESMTEIGEMCEQLGESAGKFDLWMMIRNIQNMVATEQLLRTAEED